MEHQLVPSREESRAYLLVRGLDETLLQGVEFQVNEERGAMDVYLYEQGFNDDRDAEGYRISVPMTTDTASIINRITELVVLNPESGSLRELSGDEQEELLERSDWVSTDKTRLSDPPEPDGSSPH